MEKPLTFQRSIRYQKHPAEARARQALYRLFPFQFSSAKRPLLSPLNADLCRRIHLD